MRLLLALGLFAAVATPAASQAKAGDRTKVSVDSSIDCCVRSAVTTIVS